MVEIKLFGYVPAFVDETVAAAALFTFKEGSIEEYVNRLLQMPAEKREKKVRKIHEESTGRGHASMTTTSAFLFEIKGTRAIDHYFSSFPFGSYLISSVRRIPMKKEKVYLGKLPKEAFNFLELAFEVYEEIKEKAGIDKARRLVPLGFYSRGLYLFSAETIINAKREVNLQDYPSDVAEASEKMYNLLCRVAPQIVSAAEKSPQKTSYPHPNIFKRKKWYYRENKVKVRADEELEEILHDFSEGKINSYEELAEIAREAITVQITDTLSLSVWNDIKRHRTVPQNVESIHDAAYRAYESLKRGDVKWIHIPPGLGKEKKRYVQAVEKMLEGYMQYRSNSDSLYLIPGAIKVRWRGVLNGYHLFHPLGMIGIRSCRTADYELVSLVWKWMREIEKGYKGLGKYMGPKCKTGRCPEKEPCGLLNLYRKGY